MDSNIILKTLIIDSSNANHVATLIGRCEPDEITYDELFDSYEEVCIEREKLKKM